jgi:hypothetical protein
VVLSLKDAGVPSFFDRVKKPWRRDLDEPGRGQ